MEWVFTLEIKMVTIQTYLNMFNMKGAAQIELGDVIRRIKR